MLALDFGAKRTGVAICDPTGTIVRPLPLVEKANSSDGIASIIRIVSDNQVQQVVVGLPIGLSGTETRQTAQSRSFADRLRQQLTVPVTLYDERFTSRLADAVSAETGTQTSRDSLAACHLLTSYLEAQNQ